MAAAAGTALLRSVATKMGMAAATRAPSLLHRPPLLAGLRGCRPGPASSRRYSSSSSAPSGSTPPPTNNKDLTQNKNVASKLHSTKTASRKLPAYLAYFMLNGSTAAFLYFGVNPRIEELNNEINALRMEKSILVKALEECQARYVLAVSSQSQSMQASGQVKETDGQGS